MPQGAVALERHLCCAGEMVHLTGDFQVSTRGRGRVEGYLVLPGVEVDFFLMQADRAAFRHGADCAVLEVTHCGAGRAGWNCGAAAPCIWARGTWPCTGWTAAPARR